ncbi:hypothetical protein AURDEDRAFT_172671, partial [Auricularia subglabra TFB-10046 SS5]
VIAFLQSVLIPEAALALIMEDRNSTRQEALATLRASGAYGFAMFSADDEDDARDTAGDALMRECARRRREEIEREEAEEIERATG